MRMTKHLQEAFIKAVLDDVPTLDYAEMIRPIVLADFVSQLPPLVRAVWDSPHREYINTSYFSESHDIYRSRGYWSYSVDVPIISGYDSAPRKLTPAGQKNVDKLTKKWEAQNVRMHMLKEKLEGAVKAFTTTKALREALPEFEKYLPPEEAKVSNLPALANVVANLMEAGWPKGKTPEEVADAQHLSVVK